MPPLPTLQHEAFAQALAAGLAPGQAARSAGYAEKTARVRGYAMARRPMILARVYELRCGASLPLASHQAKPLAPPPATASILSPPAIPQPGPDPRALVAPGAIEPVAQSPSPLPRIDPARASPEEYRAWALRGLAAVAEDALRVSDRRAAISAIDAAAKLNGLHTQRVEMVSRSPLDGLIYADLRRVLALINLFGQERLVGGTRVVSVTVADANALGMDPTKADLDDKGRVMLAVMPGADGQREYALLSDLRAEEGEAEEIGTEDQCNPLN